MDVRDFVFFLFLLGCALGGVQAAIPGQAVGSSMNKKDEIDANLVQGATAKVTLSEKTGRLEVRDQAGSLLGEIMAGTAGQAVDAYGQEFRLSFGKDEMGRKSVLVRAGPAMKGPVTIEILGRKAVLSPEASLLATLADHEQIYFEPSLCGKVYYIENVGLSGSHLSRLATSKKEVAVLAKPSNPNGAGPGLTAESQNDSKSMEKTGEAVKSALCTVFGLPDKQPTSKAKVYRLRGNSDTEPTPSVAAPVSAEAGRP